MTLCKMRWPVRCATFSVITLLLFVIFSLSVLPSLAQNCNVDFPGTSNAKFSTACGGSSTGDLELGKNVNLSDGDVFTFDIPIVTVTGKLHVDVEGNGKLVIPAGVTLNVEGGFDLHTKNAGCKPEAPCTFVIEVNGNATFSKDFQNDLFKIVWSGTGTVTFEDKIKNSKDACMSCGPGGCPRFEGNPAKCKDDGTCSDGDFCSKIAMCASDATPPVISGCPANQVVELNASGCAQPVSWTPPTAKDNCTLSSFTSNHSPGSSFSRGITTVTYTAKDAAGNTTTCSFTVELVDKTVPVITGCPGNIIVNADNSCQAIATWTPPTLADNCTGAILTSTKSPGSIFPKGTSTVLYTATDASGNKATCSFTVTVVDKVVPVISGCPANVTVNANNSCQAVVNWTPPTFTDNCTGGTLTSTKAPGSIFQKGISTVTYTATDASGNTATCSFTITVADKIAPVISGCPGEITVNTNECEIAVNWAAPTVVDNCAGTTLTSTSNSGSMFSKGKTTVTYSATDASGNTSTCSFIVNVMDDSAPVLLGCPSNIVVNTDDCVAAVQWTAPASDDCDLSTIVGSHRPGDTFPMGTTRVTYNATDILGNVSTCGFDVKVKSSSGPEILSCPVDIQLEASSAGNAIVTWAEPTVSVKCGQASISRSRQSGDVFELGTTEVVYTITDDSGNRSICRFNVEVIEPKIIIDISKVVTPDGNGINDEWIITNIHNFSNNEVMVFDRWGSVIFKARGYDNQRIVWRGANGAGGSVPTGTYFYSIIIQGESSKFEKRGSIELIR